MERGDQVVAAAIEHQRDVALPGIEMPGINGLAASGHPPPPLRGHRPQPSLPELLAAYSLMGLAIGVVALSSFLAELFPTRIRYSGLPLDEGA